MTLKPLLFSASAAIFMALPLAVLADPPADHAAKPDEQGQQHGGQGGGHEGGGRSSGPVGHAAGGGANVDRSTVNRPSAAAPVVRGQQRPQLEVRPQTPAGQGHPHGGAFGGAPVYTQAPARPTVQAPAHSGAFGGAPVYHQAPAAPTVRIQQGQHRFSQPQSPAVAAIRRGPTAAPLSGWNRTVRGPDRDQAGQQWRQGHAGWDSHALWRQDTNWWRHDSSFRLFLGPRIGFFFIPSIGYVSVPQQYERHYWRAADDLPRWFWRYEVREYWRYGLPQPPDGCLWVWVDNDVALIDASDGYILDIVHNAW